MKNIFLFILFIFITGCVSTSEDPFLKIQYLCNRFYDDNKRWPSSEKELILCEHKYTSDKINWNAFSGFSIENISDDQARFTYSAKRWYGINTVSGSVYRPLVDRPKFTIKSADIKIKSDNQTDASNPPSSDR